MASTWETGGKEQEQLVPRPTEAGSADSGTGRPLAGGAVSLCPAEKARRDRASLDWNSLRPQGTGIRAFCLCILGNNVKTLRPLTHR